MQASDSRPTPAVTPKDKNCGSGKWLDAWHVNPSLSKDYDAIDGLRGMAILMVVACHLIYVNPAAGPATQFLGGVFGAGTWGVTVFFTLSGFLIAHPFWKRKIQGAPQIVPPGYGYRRFWKIYPPLALSIVLLTAIHLLRSNDTSYLAIAGQWLVGWPLVHSVSGRLNPVMWSLIVEVHFYILLPLLLLCLKRFSTKHSILMVFVMLLVIPACFRWWNFSHGVEFRLHPFIEVHFPALLDAFAFGVLLAGLENLQVIKKSWARLGDIGFVLLFVSLVIHSWLTLHPIVNQKIQLESLSWGVKLASALMLCYVADPDHPRSLMFSRPWLRWCGLISYEWYLFHQPIFVWARESFGPAQGNVAKFGLIVGGSFIVGLLIAAMVYRYFSLPILRYGRSRRKSG
jgi:peptidoglycan/LPS O-acetylase OafA/YrhL